MTRGEKNAMYDVWKNTQHVYRIISEDPDGDKKMASDYFQKIIGMDLILVELGLYREFRERFFSEA